MRDQLIATLRLLQVTIDRPDCPEDLMDDLADAVCEFADHRSAWGAVDTLIAALQLSKGQIPEGSDES